VVLLQICLVAGKERDSLTRATLTTCSSDHDTIGGKWRVSIDDGLISENEWVYVLKNRVG
jgi:hypothetical protein